MISHRVGNWLRPEGGRRAKRTLRNSVGRMGWAGTFACCGIFIVAPALDAEPPAPAALAVSAADDAPSTEAASARPPSDAAPPNAAADAATAQSIRQAIEQLGSPEFAARERATEKLMEIGIAAVPPLHELSSHSDPEVRLRAADLVRQLTEGDFQARVEAFLSGEDVGFEGWDFFQQRLGSSTVMRELFIDLTRTHPSLIKSLEGTARDRALAMDATLVSVQQGMFVQRRMPTPTDAVALLLLASDPEIPLSAPYENMVLTVLRTEAGTRIQRDPPLHAPVLALVGDWVERSTLANRGEVIWFSLGWDVPEVLPLALQTLDETKDADILSTALQAIARFGTREDAPAIAKWLDDTRPATEAGFATGQQNQTQIGDVAMATIAALFDVSLAEVGFEAASEHPKYAFSIEELGFPTDDPAVRARARAKVDALLGTAAPES